MHGELGQSLAFQSYVNLPELWLRIFFDSLASTMTVPIVRKRAQKPKTRTGCLTCKSRHIKCDEQKPFCRRCVHVGRICEGYATVRENTVAERAHMALYPRPASNTTYAHTAVDHNLCHAEREALAFFCHKTAYRICNGLLNPPWRVQLLATCIRMSYSVPAVAHIAAALGFMHHAKRSVAQSTIVQNFNRLARHQRSKAMSELQRFINMLAGRYSDSEAEVVILMALLFFCYELWVAQDFAASVHLRAGLRVLYERRRGQAVSHDHSGRRQVTMAAQPGNTMSMLLSTFVRLDLDVIVNKGEAYLHPIASGPLPTSFSSIHEAMIHLDVLSASVNAITNDLLSFTLEEIERRGLAVECGPGMSACLAAALSRSISLELIPELSTRMQEERHRLHRWGSATAGIAYDWRHEQIHLQAQINFFVVNWQVLSWYEKDEMFTDSLEEQFMRILAVCERYVGLDYTDALTATGSRVVSCADGTDGDIVSIGNSLVACLCIVSLKCRRYYIRRWSLQILRSVNLQGIFDTDYLISFLQVVIDLEEAGARSVTSTGFDQNAPEAKISAEARILDIDIDKAMATAVPEFYRGDSGRVIYAVRGVGGNVEVRSAMFKVRRPALQALR